MSETTVSIKIDIDARTGGIDRVRSQLASLAAEAEAVDQRFGDLSDRSNNLHKTFLDLDKEVRKKEKDFDHMSRSVHDNSNALNNNGRQADTTGQKIERCGKRIKSGDKESKKWAKTLKSILSFGLKALLINLAATAASLVAVNLLFKAGAYIAKGWHAAITGVYEAAAAFGAVAITGFSVFLAGQKEFVAATQASRYSLEGQVNGLEMASTALRSLTSNQKLAVLGADALQMAFSSLSAYTPMTGKLTSALEAMGDFAATSGNPKKAFAAAGEFLGQLKKEGKLTDALVKSASDVGPEFAKAAEEAKKAGLTTADSFINALIKGDLSKSVKGQLDTLNQTLFGMAKSNFITIKTMFADFGQPMLAPTKDAFQKLIIIFQRTFLGITGVVRKFTGKTLFDGIVSGADKLGKWVTKMMNEYLPKVDGMFTRVTDRMRNAWEWLKSGWTRLTDALRPLTDAGQVLIDAFKPLVKGLFTGFGGGVKEFSNLVKENKSELMAFGQSLANLFAQIGRIFGAVKKAIMDILPVLEGIVNIFTKITSQIAGVFETISGSEGKGGKGGTGQMLASAALLGALGMGYKTLGDMSEKKKGTRGSKMGRVSGALGPQRPTAPGAAQPFGTPPALGGAGTQMGTVSMTAQTVNLYASTVTNAGQGTPAGFGPPTGPQQPAPQGPWGPPTGPMAPDPTPGRWDRIGRGLDKVQQKLSKVNWGAIGKMAAGVGMGVGAGMLASTQTSWIGKTIGGGLLGGGLGVMQGLKREQLGGSLIAGLGGGLYTGTSNVAGGAIGGGMTGLGTGMMMISGEDPRKYQKYAGAALIGSGIGTYQRSDSTLGGLAAGGQMGLGGGLMGGLKGTRLAGAALVGAGVGGLAKTQSVGGGVLSGGAAGLGIGMQFGPVGAAIGAGLGMAIGGIVGQFKESAKNMEDVKNAARDWAAGVTASAEDAITEYNWKGVDKVGKDIEGKAKKMDKVVKDLNLEGSLSESAWWNNASENKKRDQLRRLRDQGMISEEEYKQLMKAPQTYAKELHRQAQIFTAKILPVQRQYNENMKMFQERTSLSETQIVSLAKKLGIDLTSKIEDVKGAIEQFTGMTILEDVQSMRNALGDTLSQAILDAFQKPVDIKEAGEAVKEAGRTIMQKLQEGVTPTAADIGAYMKTGYAYELATGKDPIQAVLAIFEKMKAGGLMFGQGAQFEGFDAQLRPIIDPLLKDALVNVQTLGADAFNSLALTMQEDLLANYGIKADASAINDSLQNQIADMLSKNDAEGAYKAIIDFVNLGEKIKTGEKFQVNVEALNPSKAGGPSGRYVPGTSPIQQTPGLTNISDKTLDTNFTGILQAAENAKIQIFNTTSEGIRKNLSLAGGGLVRSVEGVGTWVKTYTQRVLNNMPAPKSSTKTDSDPVDDTRTPRAGDTRTSRIGDTNTSRIGDSASKRLRWTLFKANQFDAVLPGKREITSSYRTNNLGSINSDHVTGSAFDIVGDNLGGYADLVRSFGGFAEFHGSANDRHLHVVPSIGTHDAIQGTAKSTANVKIDSMGRRSADMAERVKQPLVDSKIGRMGRRSADAIAGGSVQKGLSGLAALAAASSAKARKQGFSPTSEGYANARRQADFDLIAYAMRSAAAKERAIKNGSISSSSRIGDTASSISGSFWFSGSYDPFMADPSTSSVLTVPMSATGDTPTTSQVTNSYSFIIQSTPNASPDQIASAVMKKIYAEQRSAKERQ